MKLKKRKIKYAAIFCLCWFAVLVFLVDGVLKFQTLVDYLQQKGNLIAEIPRSPLARHMIEASKQP